MSLNESNSTKLVLAPNAVFQGKAVRPDVKYITIQITATFTGGNSGLLEIYYSLDGIFYDTFGDSWTYTTETDEVHVFKETQMKGSYFYVKWTNNGISTYTSFNLNTKLAETTSSVSVNGVINIPTVTVDIEGQTIFSKIRDTAGNALNSTENALNVYNTNTSFEVSNFPAIQDVSGTVAISTLPAIAITNTSFEVSNFPAIQDVSGTVAISTLPAIAITNTSFEVSNFPDIQDVSGTVAISTLPAIAITNTSFEVSNFPDIQDVSGTVAISTLPAIAITNTSFEVSNFPSIQDVSGTVAISTLPAIAITNTSFEVSNFPDIQDVSGTVAISTLPAIAITNTSFEVSNFPAIQDVSGTVNVGNFPTTTTVSGSVSVSNQITGFSTSALQTAGNTSLSDIKTNSDKLKYVGDDLKTVISNTSFESKLRDGNNNIITSTVYGIDGVRGLDVSIKNATQAEPLNVAIDTTNVLTCAVNNFPAEYSISAGGALSSATGALNVNLRNTAGDAVGISGAPLVVESNLITGFALESGGNLAGVKTNTDKFKFTGDDLKTTITNTSLIVETGTNALDVNITGGTLTGANGKAYLYSGDEATSITATTVGGKNGIDSNIINSSIDTHCYGSSNGTNWHHLSTDSNGQLNVHSKLQDGVGADLTSTLNGAKQSLDVNVANNGSIIIDISGATTNINRLNVFDASANSLLSTINVGVGDFTNIFAFGNFISNASIGSSANSTTLTFTRGDYKRNTMLIYRDNSTGNTDSISFYSNSTIGTATPCLLATVYPITVGGYRWVNVNVNLLPFQDLFIRNDSTSGITGVYLSVTNG